SLEMPGDIQKIFSNPDIDSQVFATIFNTDENNDVFAYILYTPEPHDVPKIIINCNDSALLSSNVRLQTTNKKIDAPLNDPSEKHVFKMSEDNLLVACGAPVVSDLKPGHKHLVIGHHFSLCEIAEKTFACLYGYDLDKNEYSKLPNFEFNVLSFIKYPDSNVLGQVKNNSKKQDNDNTLPEFISLCADVKKECQQCNPEFIAKKLEHFILEQPKCKNASNKKLPDHCFALVFNPEAIKEQKTAKISIREQSIELTSEFQNEVQKAIESQNSQDINIVITEFGQFIPTTARECGQGIEVQNNFGSCSKSESIMQQKISTIFGGDKKKMYEGKEAEWKFSLQDFRSWEPIEFRKPVSIFEFLEEDLKKKIREIIGKGIIYSNFQDYEFKFNNLRNIVSLEMAGDVQKIFSNPDIDSQVFATIFNTDKNNDVFAYILYTPELYDVPKIIVNCIQSNNEQQRVCQIKIGWILLDISSTLLSSDVRRQTANKKK
ncbi:32622_t:CDS:2, partial [Gigaspora margarita]